MVGQRLLPPRLFLRVPLSRFIRWWSNPKAHFQRRDSRVEFGKLLLQGLLQVLQFFFCAEQLLKLLDALTLDVRRGRRSRLRLH